MIPCSRPPPPLEAVRFLLSDLATRKRAGDYKKAGPRKALLIDVSKAHLHAFVKRDVYVALPPEIAKPGMCAKLVRSLYGMREAPARWEELYTATLEGLGFLRGRAIACCLPIQGATSVVSSTVMTSLSPGTTATWIGFAARWSPSSSALALGNSVATQGI